MRRILLAIAITAAALAAPTAHGAPATCTVTDLDVAGTFPFNNIGGVGLVIPLDIEGGRITMQRDAFTSAYPSPGLEFATGFGPSGWVDWDPGLAEGTIDGNGLVVFPGFGMRFFTDFGTPGVAALAGNINATFSSGIQARAVSGRSFLFSGERLAADGTLRLVGTDFINFQLPLQTGAGMTCRIEPAPNLADLPAGPSLASAKGKVKAGPDAAAADDELALTAGFVFGETPPPLDGAQDVLLRLRAEGGDPLTLLAPAGTLQARGKKLKLKDGDGSMLERISDAPTGQEPPPTPPATKGGSLLVRKAKKRATLVYKVRGVDAAQFSGPVEVTVGLGNQSAVRMVTFAPGRKGPKFK